MFHFEHNADEKSNIDHGPIDNCSTGYVVFTNMLCIIMWESTQKLHKLIRCSTLISMV